MRKEHPALIYGTYDIVAEDHPTVFAYIRRYNEKEMLIIVNLSFKEASIEINTELVLKKLLLSNQKVEKPLINDSKFSPYEARIYELQDK